MVESFVPGWYRLARNCAVVVWFMVAVVTIAAVFEYSDEFDDVDDDEDDELDDDEDDDDDAVEFPTEFKSLVKLYK